MVFHVGWLSKRDKNGHLISSWLVPVDDDKDLAKCSVCCKTINVSRGMYHVNQHAGGSTHKENAAVKLNKLQLRLESVRNSSDADGGPAFPGPSSSKTTNAPLQVASLREKSSVAELRWVMKCIVSNYSASSCEGIGDLFASMFGQETVDDFSLSRTKVRYLTTDALGPYFRRRLLDDMANSTYCLSFDETCNNAQAKELQIHVTYWSRNSRKIAKHHLRTYFIGSATAEILVEKLNHALDEADLSRDKLLMIGMDGPNVNKKVQRLLNEQMISERGRGLVNIGSCNIHILHNAFAKGLAEFGHEASELVYKMHRFFHDWPTRREDFEDIQRKVGVPDHQFLKHVESRWLTLEPAAQRLLEQWPAINEYFNKFVPRSRASLMKTPLYKDIVLMLKEPNMKALLIFICSSARTFTQFTGCFQAADPMIHLLYDEILRLAKTLIGRVSKACSVKELGVSKDVLSPQHLLSLEEVPRADELDTELFKLGERDRLIFLKKMQNHYVSACIHILDKSALGSSLVKLCRCLQPNRRKSSRSGSEVASLARELPIDVDVTLLQDEWRLLVEETIKTEKGARIDVYWSQFFGLETARGEKKYPTVETVVKSALALSHGNADLERGFSLSGRFLTDDKASMCERTLDAALTVKSGLREFDSKPQLVPITRELLNLSKNAWIKYKAYLEMKKNIREKEEKRKAEEALREAEEAAAKEKMLKEAENLREKEGEIKEIRKNEESKRKTASTLLNEANKRLKTAIKTSSIAEVAVAQAMLDTATKVESEAVKNKRKGDTLQKTVDSKKDRLISSYFKKI